MVDGLLDVSLIKESTNKLFLITLNFIQSHYY